MNADDYDSNRAEEIRLLRMKLLQAIVKNERGRRPEIRLARNAARATGRVIFERTVPKTALIEKALVAH